jgi:CheY-like chemotaxis protein
MKVWVIEDDPTVGQFVKRGLEEARYTVDLVADGEEGEALAKSQPYDLVVLDLRLPGRSGQQVLRNLRARGFEIIEYPQLPANSIDLNGVFMAPGAVIGVAGVPADANAPGMFTNVPNVAAIEYVTDPAFVSTLKLC